jgi:hypothetical protein
MVGKTNEVSFLFYRFLQIVRNVYVNVSKYIVDPIVSYDMNHVEANSQVEFN